MFSVIYTFEVKPDQEQNFIRGWKGLTELIYQNEGSRGSRLHRIEGPRYLAYACWPNKSTWLNSGKNMPPEADYFRKLMHESCHKIETNFEMELVEDLLQDQVFCAD
jgi:heme-degrading monooxygenase HmoA